MFKKFFKAIFVFSGVSNSFSLKSFYQKSPLHLPLRPDWRTLHTLFRMKSASTRTFATDPLINKFKRELRRNNASPQKKKKKHASCMSGVDFSFWVTFLPLKCNNSFVPPLFLRKNNKKKPS